MEREVEENMRQPITGNTSWQKWMRGSHPGKALVGSAMFLAGICATEAAAQGAPQSPCAQQSAILLDDSGERWASENKPVPLVIDGSQLKSPTAFRDAIERARAQSDRHPSETFVEIAGGNFSGWDFAGLVNHLANICFHQSDLSYSRWDASTVPNLIFARSTLTGASFLNATLPGVRFQDTSLRDVDMQDARLDGGHFSGGWDTTVDGWNLSGAIMTEFRFECGITISDGCPLDRDGISFRGADLTDVDISSFPTWGQSDFTGAIFQRTRISPQQIPYLGDASIHASVLVVGGAAQVLLDRAEFASLQTVVGAYALESMEPSFACEKARSRVERMICGELQDNLRYLDRVMAVLFMDTRRVAPGVIPAQKRWMRERDRCADVACVENAYLDRIARLNGIRGDVGFLEPGQSAFFIHDTVGLPESFIGTPLYDKIVPALAGASRMSARVTRAPDGSYTIWGQAIGANAHTCSLYGTGARFDSYSGWYSVEAADGRKVPLFQILEGTLHVTANGKPQDFPAREDQAYVTCGARASFTAMRRLDHDPELLERWLVPFLD
ncbi:pentapeptide repeat-containing protein [Paraurantiacibacter namhicola]|uniref:Pentapeptide repeats (8 copies) n=1 Tax=Paraurantiacibacter namhicola TaxID=645517 RepID=A0A1C7DB79_9SPHN|nr:pentapeptide repeat-containing protein [Paraurantiacibacter namhicola]ANU08705.1 Pentapeptide repeats (8 copies) [Paraurantiacibacter namhicola]